MSVKVISLLVFTEERKPARLFLKKRRTSLKWPVKSGVKLPKTKLAESNFASLSDMMAAYAEEAVRAAWADHRRRLDLSESSVEVLEQILDGQSPKTWSSRRVYGAATSAR